MAVDCLIHLSFPYSVPRMGTERTDDAEVGVVSQDHLIDKVP